MFSDQSAFLNFDISVRSQFRYARTPDQQAFLDAVTKTSGNRVRKLKAGSHYFRAQLGHSWREETVLGGHDEEIRAAHDVARMVPDPAKVGDGRVNVKGIVCLYLATNEKTAALEVRPLIGSYVSIATFRIVRDLRIVDCSEKLVGNLERCLRKEWTPEDVERQVWNDINDAFSQPVERSDAELTYIPTQIIAETLRLQGYDGVAYKSGYGENGFNIALLDINAAELRSCGLHTVGKMQVELRMAGNTYYVTGPGLVENVISDVLPVGAEIDRMED